MVEELKRVSKPTKEFSPSGTELVAGKEEEGEEGEEEGKEEEKEWHSFQNVLRWVVCPYAFQYVMCTNHVYVIMTYVVC